MEATAEQLLVLWLLPFSQRRRLSQGTVQQTMGDEYKDGCTDRQKKYRKPGAK